MATDPDDAASAANRFGMGAKPGELNVIAGDPRGWLLEQLKRQRATSVIDTGYDLRSGTENLSAFLQNRAVRSALKQENTRAQDQAVANGVGVVQGVMAHIRPVYLAEVGARAQTGLRTDAPFAERLARFWSNHFTVSAQKPVVASLAGSFEREAIRPHILGRFEDMLLASTHHQAMILYLDNHISFGPNSRVGRKRKRGLNENLAREILELHTLGVNGGYAQQDVTSFAEALTGWTIDNGRRRSSGCGRAQFVDWVHEPGAKTIIGKRYADNGVGQAESVLRDLARHPSTARHIATKLARHFIADDPPAGAVDTLAKTFLDTSGDLTAVSRRLVSLDAPWENSLSKIKSPSDYLISALRGLDISDIKPKHAVGSLMIMGQRPYAAPSPAGWPDRAADWAAPDAVYKRIEWATALAERLAPYRPNGAGLAKEMLGGQLGDATSSSIAQAESSAQAITLLLSSPEFQRR